jgi:hypothetical protein
MIRCFILCLCVLLLVTGCAQSVDRAPRGTITLLKNNTVAADPLDFEKGQVRPRYQWQIKPGTIIRASFDTALGIPSVEGQIDGQSTRLILDTGNAFPVLLDASSAASIGIPTVRSSALKGTGIGGNVDVLLAQYRSLKINEQPILGRGLAGVFLHSYRKTFAGVTVNEMKLNLLGLPLLQQFSSITIDGPQNSLVLAYKRPFTPARGSASFPFTIQDGRMWVKIKVDQQSISAFFDTGCGSGLRLSAQALAKIPKTALVSTTLRKRKAMGVGGVEQEQVGVLKQAQLGSIRMIPLEFDTSANSSDILLGWLPFKQSRMTIDFERRTVWIAPPRND